MTRIVFKLFYFNKELSLPSSFGLGLFLFRTATSFSLHEKQEKE